MVMASVFRSVLVAALLSACFVQFTANAADVQKDGCKKSSSSLDEAKVVPYLKGRTDKDPLSYRVGEEIVFTVTLHGAATFPDGVMATWRRTGDDGVEESGAWDGKSPLVVKTRLARAGFMRLTVEPRWTLSGKRWREKGAINDVFFDGGAAADVFKLKQSKPEPEDFDKFWQTCREKLDALPMTSTLEEIPSPGNEAKLYKVKVSCPGGTGVTSGFLSVPQKPGKYRAVANFFGYNESWSKKAYTPPKTVSATSINFYVSAHGYELCREDEYYVKLRRAVRSNGFGHGFDPEQNKNPETCYFSGMAMRALRAVDYLKTRPEWDGKNLLVAGGSQGALQSMWCAAFAPGVSESWVVIPWLCDVGGTEDGRNHGDWYPKWARGLDYFDQVNVAKRVPRTCYVAVVRIGLGDYIAPPCGTAIMFQALKCRKRAVWMQGATHDFVPFEPQKIEW